jgi:hypothetical protein
MTPLVFGLPLWYNQRLPDQAGLDKTKTGASAPQFYLADSSAIALSKLWDFLSPERTSLCVQIKFYNKLIQSVKIKLKTLDKLYALMPVC